MSSPNPSECLSDFDSLPWCQAIISDPAYVPFPVRSRQTTTDPNTEHSLFGITLYTHSTIRACLIFHRKGVTASNESSLSHSSSSSSSAIAKSIPKPEKQSHSPLPLPLPSQNEITMLISLGPHMNSHPSTLHGGIAVMLMDEAIGCLVLSELNLDRGGGNGIFTRTLQVVYSGIIVTPGVVRVRAWKDEEGLREGEVWGIGRKWWTRARIEDGGGRVLVEGRYLFVRVRGSL